MPKSTSFTSRAWLLNGPVHSLPGLLSLIDDQLSYLALEQGTFSDERVREIFATSPSVTDTTQHSFPKELFSVSIKSISRFHIPWYYFGSGGKLDLGKQSYRFSFVKPQNTVEPTYYSEAFQEWRGGAGQEEVNILEGKASGKTWKSLLTP